MSLPRNKTILSVDTGGTFTDLIAVDESGVRTWKLPSTSDDPSRAVLEGTALLLGEESGRIVHGSTVATNALLEGKGATVALVVTEGFADLLLIGRQNRPRLYELHPARRAPLVLRECVIEVPERIGPDGAVEIPLSEENVAEIVRRVRRMGCGSVAICLLHAYANPSHEEMIAEALRREGLRVSESHRILPEYREFERASTTVVNAAVSPVMTHYLGRIGAGIGVRPLNIMQSNGGVISSETAGNEAVRTILSGPAGGVVGAFEIASRAGFTRIITFDMGGTSTDVALCDDKIPTTGETVIAGTPVKVPMIDIHTVGAGGGSIAAVDAGGALRVGPESAGADPGPACYGKGDFLTVTDANLCLGRLLPDLFLGGRMNLDRQRATALLDATARETALHPQHLAEGIVEVAEETMAAALRLVSVERGHDPRDFTLVPFGGAGGLHACALAEKLGIPRIFVPPFPGLLSAVGMALAGTVRDDSLSVLKPGETPDGEIDALLRPLRERAIDAMAAEGADAATVTLAPYVDMRYAGQSFEITVPFAGDFRKTFHAMHEGLYGYRDERRPVEIVTLRLRATAPARHPEIVPVLPCATEPVSCRTVPVVLAGKEVLCPVYDRERLPAGASIAGPALVVEATATHLVTEGWTGRVDLRGNLLLEGEAR